MKSRLSNVGAVVGFLVLAIIFYFVGGDAKKFNANCKETDGQITRVLKRTASEKFKKGPDGVSRKEIKYKYDTYFTYTIDGKQYEEMDSLYNELPEGPHVVYYLADQPDKGKLEKENEAAGPVGMMICLAAAGFFAYKAIRGSDDATASA